jgi:hypothetical protein
MSEYFKPTLPWIEMAEEVISHARSHKAVDDYKYFCEVQIPSNEKNISSRTKVITTLLDEGIVKISDKKLLIGNLNNSHWIEKGLLDGCSNIWALAKATQPNAHIFKKFDSDKLAEIGLSGEKHVIKRLEMVIPQERHVSIKLVSEYNDTLGYDIQTPSTKFFDKIIFLEVKTTVIQDAHFSLFLSRNEYRVSQKEDKWYIVLVRITNGVPAVLGHIRGSSINGLMPVDSDVNVTWQTAKIKVDAAWIIPELP